MALEAAQYAYRMAFGGCYQFIIDNAGRAKHAACRICGESEEEYDDENHDGMHVILTTPTISLV